MISPLFCKFFILYHTGACLSSGFGKESAALQACVYDAFYQIMKPQYGDDPVECCEARFYSYVLDEWIKRGFYETPEQLTALFREVGRDVGRREPPTSACYFRQKGLQWCYKTIVRREIPYGS